jgi:hypothetical protein
MRKGAGFKLRGKRRNFGSGWRNWRERGRAQKEPVSVLITGVLMIHLLVIILDTETARLKRSAMIFAKANPTTCINTEYAPSIESTGCL